MLVSAIGILWVLVVLLWLAGWGIGLAAIGVVLPTIIIVHIIKTKINKNIEYKRDIEYDIIITKTKLEDVNDIDSDVLCYYRYGAYTYGDGLDMFKDAWSASPEEIEDAKSKISDNDEIAMNVFNTLKTQADISPTEGMILRGILAQDRSVLPEDIEKGIEITCSDDMKFVRWYNKELKDNAFPSDLLFIPEDQMDLLRLTNDVKHAVKVTDHMDTNLKGVCFWKPTMKSQEFWK